MRRCSGLCGCLVAAVGLLAGLSTGCAAGRGDQGGRGVSRIHAVTLHAMPTAINWDGEPGPDGVRAGVYLFRRDRDASLMVAEGTVEFVLYDGLFRAEELDGQPVFRRWRFPADLLPAYRVRSIVGPGYRVQLGWGAAGPTSSSLTLVARHVAADGTAVDSRPLTIQVPGR